MAISTNDDKGLFWNSQGGDRKYDADSMGKWLSKFFTGGVFAEDCKVTATGNGLQVSMATGYVNVNNPNASSNGGKVRLFEAPVVLDLEMADAIRPRIDTVVIERNDNERTITAKIITGTPAVTPLPVDPVRTEAIYQLVVAEVYVAAGATSITNANITRTVTDNTRCGVVTGTVANNQITYGTEDLTPGVSELADGTVYFVYV